MSSARTRNATLGAVAAGVAGLGAVKVVNDKQTAPEDSTSSIGLQPGGLCGRLLESLTGSP
jgi:hypothetical protein